MATERAAGFHHYAPQNENDAAIQKCQQLFNPHRHFFSIK
jgi:hypothetical protein